MTRSSLVILSLILAGTLALSGCGETDTSQLTSPSTEDTKPSHTPIDWAAVEAEAVKPTSEEEGLLQKIGATPVDLKSSTLPVLIPRIPEVLQRLEVKSYSHLYVAIAGFSDHRVVVKGVRVAGIEQAERNERSAVEVKRGFMRWGAYYEVVLTCQEGAQNAPCTDETAMDDLIGSLIWAGPATPESGVTTNAD